MNPSVLLLYQIMPQAEEGKGKGDEDMHTCALTQLLPQQIFSLTGSQISLPVNCEEIPTPPPPHLTLLPFLLCVFFPLFLVHGEQIFSPFR